MVLSGVSSLYSLWIPVLFSVLYLLSLESIFRLYIPLHGVARRKRLTLGVGSGETMIIRLLVSFESRNGL